MNFEAKKFKIWYPKLKFYDRPYFIRLNKPIVIHENPKRNMKLRDTVVYYDLFEAKDLSVKMVASNYKKRYIPLVNLSKLYLSDRKTFDKERFIISKMLRKVIFYFGPKEEILSKIPTIWIIRRLAKVTKKTESKVKQELELSYKSYFMKNLDPLSFYKVDFHRK